MARASRYLALALLTVLSALLVEVLFESWVQELFGHRTIDTGGNLVGDLPGWPKAVKNGLILLLVALSAAKVTVERRWREFSTRADLALVVLIVIMILAGAFGTSGPVLIGQAIFVYLRGAIVFYAVRALRPTWPQARRVLWIVGSVIGLNVLVAVVQMVADKPAYTGLGLVDHTWADIHRATGLLDHPNHLGHVLGLVLIGLLAFMTGLPRLGPDAPAAARKQRRLWWAALAAAALGLAAAQSRESMLATLFAGGVIWFLRNRVGGRTLLVATAIIGLLFAANLLIRPGNLHQLAYRVGGFFHAVQTPAGEEDCREFETIHDCVEANQVESREIRLLFYQQGARLLVHRPILGYGVGQFGGYVAEQHDPHWEDDPRFPGGFNLYDFNGTTIDTFWLHLTVETGFLGLLAYLAWLWFILVPLLGVTARVARRRGLEAPPAEDRTQAVALWGIGALLFTVIVAALSPALEDPLFPPLLFAVLGLGWVLAGPDRAVLPFRRTGDVRHDAGRRSRHARTDALGS